VNAVDLVAAMASELKLAIKDLSAVSSVNQSSSSFKLRMGNSGTRIRHYSNQ